MLKPIKIVKRANAIYFPRKMPYRLIALLGALIFYCLFGNNPISTTVHAQAVHESVTVAEIHTPAEEALEPLKGITDIATGYYHSCALTAGGAVLCWGENQGGQLGIGSTRERSTAHYVVGLTSRVVAIDAGQDHTCALTEKGGVQCWGKNEYGQLGDGTNETRYYPTDVVGLSSGVIAIASEDYYSCALTEEGAVKCWGDNSDGQLGDGTKTNSLVPKDVVGLASGNIAISTGQRHACTLTTAGGARCWGNNSAGQIGSGSTASEHLSPVFVQGLSSGVASISAGSAHTCALLDDGMPKCWGRNQYGGLGTGDTVDSNIPIEPSTLTSSITAISAGGYRTCVVTTAGGVQCWGLNNFGQLGDGTLVDSTAPVDVVNLTERVTEIEVKGPHSCALLDDGGVNCWGRNTFGQLGDATTLRTGTPTDVDGLTANSISLSASSIHNCVLTDADEVMCWGNNDHGQTGSFPDLVYPTAISITGVMSSVVDISTGVYHSCAIVGDIDGDADGQVQCWGSNNYWQLGSETYIRTDDPQMIEMRTIDDSGVTIDAPLDEIVAVASGQTHNCALNSSGGVQCWGFNGIGQLGDGTTTDRFYAAEVSGLANGVVDVTSGWFHACALTEDSSVKCWGNNNDGQIGNDSTLVEWTVPVDVVGLSSDVTAIASGAFHNCAITSDGGVQCWGSNFRGQLGDGTTETRYTPAEVVGLPSRAIALSAGIYHTCALLEDTGLFCWGHNEYGQLGIGTFDDVLDPVEAVTVSADIASVSAGGHYTCIQTTSGSVQCWGRDGFSQLGNGRSVKVSEAREVLIPTPKTSLFLPLVSR